jgi:hypothetical protein
MADLVLICLQLADLLNISEKIRADRCSGQNICHIPFGGTHSHTGWVNPRKGLWQRYLSLIQRWRCITQYSKEGSDTSARIVKVKFANGRLVTVE